MSVKKSLSTALEVKNATPEHNKETLFRIADVNSESSEPKMIKGLYLVITKESYKRWNYRYKHPQTKKSRNAGLGSYPDTTLKEAKHKASEYTSLLKEGLDPIECRRTDKAKDRNQRDGEFHRVVSEWLKTRHKLGEPTKAKKYRNFERDIFPYFCEFDSKGKITKCKHIADITANELLYAIQQKQKTSIETGMRIHLDCRKIWEYAIAKDLTNDYILAKIVDGEVTLPDTTHAPKIDNNDDLKQLIHSIEHYNGSLIVRLLLKFVLYTPLRPENVTSLQWDMVDFQKELLTIPRSQMKIKDKNLPDFKVPLSRQSLEILKEIKHFTHHTGWIFHSLKDFNQHINKESPNKALRLMRFDGVTHPKQTLRSFRGTFRTLAENYQSTHNISYEIRERALDHHFGNRVARAYMHNSDLTDDVKKLLQWWADFLDNLKKDEV